MKDQYTDRPVRRKVGLQDITTRTEVFQYRHFEVDKQHVDALSAFLRTGNPLDPLTVWRDPSSSGLVVVDGHHRLAAYRQAGWTKKVPVVIHSCDLDQARLMALDENGKTRLPLTPDERADAAWSLVCLGNDAYSKSVVVKATGVSDGTVAKMRRTRKALIERDAEAELPDTWRQAMASLADREHREFTEEEREAMIEAKAAQLDAQIGNALGHMAANQIEAACAVVAKRLGRQGLRFLVEEYHDECDPFGVDHDADDTDEEPF